MGARETFAELQSEGDFQAVVVEYARLRNWFAYHTFDSRRSQPGFPDLVLVRGDRLIVAELKSKTGRLTMSQELWIDRFRKVGDRCTHVDVYVWVPADWSEIEQVLA